MGMYDEFTGECPSCKKEFYSQTKMGECILSIFKVGEKCDLGIQGTLGLKDPCTECGKYITAHISGGILRHYSTDEAEKAEGPWGSLQEK